MWIDEGRRLALADAAKQALGDEAGVTLMALLPPVGWADVATKQDLAALEQRLDARFAIVDVKLGSLEQRMDARFAVVDLKLESLEHRLVAQFDRGFRQVLVTVSALVVSGFAASIVASLAK